MALLGHCIGGHRRSESLGSPHPEGQEQLHQYASSDLLGDGSEGLLGSPGTPKGWSLQPVVDELPLLVPSILVSFPLPCLGLLAPPTRHLLAHPCPPLRDPRRQCPATCLSSAPAQGTWPSRACSLSQNPGGSLAHLQGWRDKEGEPAPQWLETCFEDLLPQNVAFDQPESPAGKSRRMID